MASAGTGALPLQHLKRPIDFANNIVKGLQEQIIHLKHSAAELGDYEKRNNEVSTACPVSEWYRSVLIWVIGRVTHPMPFIEQSIYYRESCSSSLSLSLSLPPSSHLLVTTGQHVCWYTRQDYYRRGGL
eukprot:TRINITY_DN6197_c0_g1_i1.p1 TRINITY_DN6197_c0_g1~~TRINITY_DN6197_c0_g1_i1.p1  ORF type:complete len:129 (-),score=6.79 TRINITY_DN6197_c0_g1_i1:616-1002(-)